MKLRLDEYYYILNIDYGCDDIESYMPKDMAEEFIKFRASHDFDEIYNYLKDLYSYIEIVDTQYDIAGIDLEACIAYIAIIKINNKYYSFNWYDTCYSVFERQIDADEDLIEVFPKEVTVTKYEPK